MTNKHTRETNVLINDHIIHFYMTKGYALVSSCYFCRTDTIIGKNRWVTTNNESYFNFTRIFNLSSFTVFCLCSNCLSDLKKDSKQFLFKYKLGIL
ncbi:MAG: hypothetical protein CMC55_08645 [Flavobacteriaceae bacterium]|nr:hypothetical protein [Flavobacteriaceae bacterium]